MIRVSRKYAVALTVVSVVAALPVYLHAAGGLEVDDCADPAAVARIESLSRTTARERRKESPDGVVQWSEGDFAQRGGRGGQEMRVALIRSFDPAQVVWAPFRPVTRGFEAGQAELRWSERGTERLPVHWLMDVTKRPHRFAAYVYLYRGEPVTSPVQAVFGDTLGRLLHGARPLTLLAVGGELSEGRESVTRREADRWLWEAWGLYRSSCAADPGAARG